MGREDHLKRLIQNHQRRLELLKEQQALEGMSVDPKIKIQIQDIEEMISNLKLELDEMETRSSPSSVRQTKTRLTRSPSSLSKPVRRQASFTKKMGFFDFIINPPGGSTGIIVLLALLVGGELIAIMVGTFVTESPYFIAGSLVSIVILLAAIYWIRQRSKPLVMVPDDEQPPKYRGLIVLVGTGRPGEDPMSQSAGIAIEYHLPTAPDEIGLETCWLICSGGERGSFPIAQRLQTICQERGINAYLRPVGNPFKLQETYEMVQRIYGEELPEAGLREYEVIADFTGGVKPMSAGMILACGDRRPMQYMTGRKEGIASTPQLIKFTPQN